MRNEIVVGVLVFIISAPFGYITNSYLSRDKVTIENLEIIPVSSKFIINKGELSKIKNFRYSDNYTNNFRFQNLPDELNSYQVSWLERNLMDNKIDAEIYLKDIRFSLNVVNSMPEGSKGQEIFSSIDSSIITPSIYVEPKEVSKLDVMNSLRNKISAIESHLNDIVVLMRKISEFNEVRTGAFNIVATLLNSGDTDGLVKYKGLISIKNYGDQIPVEIKRDQIKPEFFGYFGGLDNFSSKSKSTSISKRSMVELIFSISDENYNDKLVQEVRELVKTKRPLDINLSLTDFRNEKITSEYYKLYATD
ncbi:hypothetical protein MUS1_11025 [Marinomonas ushuaiensis DSM 15871]|uniref:Uncharacterized protein n=1 Tax=Marinomonas ushuaiensis DSM 15871 TaxID=1122207 RepID=X7E6F7_9GAMM|nr:hypothetical protein [Marinomonas ushuaiensis]ETX11405.1 hypothetical protein MUS1_11025 [Marinomonas ushuaiensis DSM 15871]